MQIEKPAIEVKNTEENEEEDEDDDVDLSKYELDDDDEVTNLLQVFLDEVYDEM